MIAVYLRGRAELSYLQHAVDSFGDNATLRGIDFPIWRRVVTRLRSAEKREVRREVSARRRDGSKREENHR